MPGLIGDYWMSRCVTLLTGTFLPRKVKAAWRFPLEIDTANSSAKLENGVLTLTLGKKVPVSNVTHLDIQ